MWWRWNGRMGDDVFEEMAEPDDDDVDDDVDVDVDDDDDDEQKC